MKKASMKEGLHNTIYTWRESTRNFYFLIEKLPKQKDAANFNTKLRASENKHMIRILHWFMVEQSLNLAAEYLPISSHLQLSPKLSDGFLGCCPVYVERASTLHRTRDFRWIRHRHSVSVSRGLLCFALIRSIMWYSRNISSLFTRFILMICAVSGNKQAYYSAMHKLLYLPTNTKEGDERGDHLSSSLEILRIVKPVSI